MAAMAVDAAMAGSLAGSTVGRRDARGGSGGSGGGPVLVVDLDGTLIRTDALFESFWSALSADWRCAFRSASASLGGRAALKRRLAGLGRLDAASLPYDDGVIGYVEAWRARGGRTALVTASDHAIAEQVGAHLGLFDEVHGSDGRTNLKGEAKARFLAEAFGERAFAYMGDANADLAVWRRAGKAITVNAPQGLRARAEGAAGEVEHLTTAPRRPGQYLRALRPHQWLKNVLVFLPMLAAHQLDLATFLLSFVAFVAFSLVASCVYVLNDLLDLAADRAHPRKRLRPFASGAVPLAHGTFMAAALGLAGGGVALSLGLQFTGVLLGYFLATGAYSLLLKRRPVIDICALAGLYTLRIVAGGAATGIALSVWLLAFSIFFFFALAAVKRQAELVDAAARGALDPAGRGYQVDDLPLVSMMALGSGYVAVLVMALYVNSPAVVALYPQPAALWGICLVLLYWISRVVLVTHRGQMHDDPVVFAARDRVSRICALFILGFALAGALA